MVLNTLNLLEEMYEENPTLDGFCSIKIKDKEFIILKSQTIIVLKHLLNKEYIDYDFCLEIIRELRDNANFEDSHHLSSIEHNILKDRENNLYCLERIRNTKEINKKISDIYSISQECKRFDSFKDDQNLYDNMLSIMKIINRLRHSNIKIIKEELYFSTNEDLSEKYKNLLLKNNERNFESIRFLI